VDGVAHLDLSRRDQPPIAVDHLHLAAGQRALQALPEPVDDLVLVAVHPRHVHAVERGQDAERGAVRGVVRYFRAMQQCLGRETATVQAGAADFVLLDQRDPLAEFRGAQRAGVAAAAPAEDDKVVGPVAVRHHKLLAPISYARPSNTGPGYSLPSATARAICTSALVAAPVPPLGVYPCGALSLKAG